MSQKGDSYNTESKIAKLASVIYIQKSKKIRKFIKREKK